MVLTVFRARLKDEGRDAYYALAPRMGELARAMPGYKSHKVFVAEDGERFDVEIAAFVLDDGSNRVLH